MHSCIPMHSACIGTPSCNPSWHPPTMMGHKNTEIQTALLFLNTTPPIMFLFFFFNALGMLKPPFLTAYARQVQVW